MRHLRLLSAHGGEAHEPEAPEPQPRFEPEPRFDLVVLDLDGTICKLDVAWEDVKRELVISAGRHGLDTSGHRRVLALLDAARHQGSLAALREMERSLELAELAGASRCLVNEELAAWVEELPSAVPVAVLSLNCLASTERALRRAGLEWRISDIVARENVDRLKPDPEGLRLLVERHVARAERSLYVGDAESDRKCAEAAGVGYRDVREMGVIWVEPAASVTA